ncbi:MAG: phospho-sugar mutase [Planctomycetia bacterium]|nr:phospho-sugar mutase [Planctomycetia bacterium]
MSTAPDTSLAARLAAIDAARAAGTITEHSAQTMRDWLTQPRYAEFAGELATRIDQAAAEPAVWKELDDVYWTVIPFGTGGRRGRMYPVGSNAINDRTIGESAQGLADYVRSVMPAGQEPSCAIAYDTRHRSEHFAKLCAEVLLAAGFRIFFLRGFRSTPELSYAVRHTQSTCGIMVTASHNPPSDNAVKVYWAGGVQVLPPHDKGIIDRVMRCDAVHRESFDAGVAAGRVQFVEQEIDPAFVAAVLRQSIAGPRDVSILYTPLHGVGASAVVPVLDGAGFKKLRLYGPQEMPDGDFPNVPGHVANPENPAVLQGAMTEAKDRSDDLVMASDPDCDRLGAAAPLTMASGCEWQTFTGNQIAALLVDWVLSSRKRLGTLSATDHVITTLVTTGLVRRIADAYGATTVDTLQVGFKWIGQAIDQNGPEHFIFGCEESHGYLAGTHVRDKDASVAALLLAELTATLKPQGKTLHEQLDAIFCTYGCHLERQVAITLPGAAGMDRMREIMATLRSKPPAALGGLPVARVRDYGSLTTSTPGAVAVPFAGAKGDLVMFDLADPAAPAASLTVAEVAAGRFPALANCVAARPSGTEPKIKFYLFAAAPPCSRHQLAETKSTLTQRLDALERDLRSLAGV